MTMESVNKYSYHQTNAVALAAAGLITRQGTRYRVFVGWHDVGNPNFPATLVWLAFKMVTKPWGEDWERVPCSSRSEERKFPKTVSRLGHELCSTLRSQNGVRA
jgi:hypothetical protein